MDIHSIGFVSVLYLEWPHRCQTRRSAQEEGRPIVHHPGLSLQIANVQLHLHIRFHHLPRILRPFYVPRRYL